MRNTRLRCRLVEGDLTEMAVDAIVNPANSLGVMGGGVAGAILRKGGTQIEKEATSQAPIPIGKAVRTTAGDLPCRHIIHAPTMTQPAEVTNLEHVQKATRAALECADEAGLKQIAFPGMGTGVGRVKPELAARAMFETVVSFRPRSLREVIFVSFNDEMKQAFARLLPSDAVHA